MPELIVYCNCFKKATDKIDSSLLRHLKFDSDGSTYFENDNLQIQYDELLKKYCVHGGNSIAISVVLPRNLPTLIHFLETELSEHIQHWEILSREFIYAGNSSGIIKVTELDIFKTEIGLLWNHWENVLNSDKEIEDLIIEFESVIKTAIEMNNPILIS